MKDYLRSILRDALLALDVNEEEIPEIEIEKPNQPEHGDAATNLAMQLAGTLRDNPRSIAGRIVEALDYDERRVASVEIAGPGFINFRYADAWLVDELSRIEGQGEDFGRTGSYAGQKALVEFVSANPTGPLTVGHGRNAVLGDTIARLLEWSGAEVDREYYFNDAGRQMRLLGESVRARYLQELGRGAELPEEGYQGEYIREIARAMADEHGDDLADTDEVEPFREKAKEMIFEEIQATLARMGIRMDRYFNEGSLYEDGSIDRVLEVFREKNLTYDEEGAVWFRTTDFGKDKDTVLVKSSGEPTYRLPDIAYHADKLERDYDLHIDVFGADHIDTFPDVLSGVEVLGYDASKVDVVVYQFVSIVKEGKPFKMSTRKANFVTLDELMDEVGADVTRFFFLMRSPNTHLEFDIAEAKEAGEKNPVFYLQYAHARIQSILRKVAEEYGEDESAAELERLDHPSETQLIKSMVRFPEIVQSAAEHREPHRLISYLNDLASHFTTFYHDCRILGEEPELAMARTRLARATAVVLANGLTILGISAPDQM
ncbi:MAG: arginine--tRNA ligase [Balneolaceae bacterium]|nr:arginine--tRNA ligase [Balneolaceae bacterium]